MSIDHEKEHEEKDLQACFNFLGWVEVSNHLEHFAKSEDLKQFADFEDKHWSMANVVHAKYVYTDLFER